MGDVQSGKTRPNQDAFWAAVEALLITSGMLNVQGYSIVKFGLEGPTLLWVGRADTPRGWQGRPPPPVAGKADTLLSLATSSLHGSLYKSSV